MITAGTIGVTQATVLPYFEGNTASAADSNGNPLGSAITNGNIAYDNSASEGYFDLSATGSPQTIYQYENGSSRMSSNGLLPLVAAQADDTLLLDLDGSGKYIPYETLTPKALGLSAGTIEIAFRYLDEDEAILAEGVLNLTVFVQSPTITVYGQSLADGQALKLVFDLCFTNGRTIGQWIVHWGNDSSTVYDNVSRKFNTIHYYAPQADDAEYSVSLELIDTDGFGAGTTYLVARHTVLGIGTGAAVESVAPAADTLESAASMAVSTVVADEKPLAAVILPEKARFASVQSCALPLPLGNEAKTLVSSPQPYETLPMSACDFVWSEDDFSLAESDFDTSQTNDSDSDGSEPFRRGELLEAVWGETF